MFENIYTTKLVSDKKAVEKRFNEINRRKRSSVESLCSVMAAVVIVCAVFMVNGIISDKNNVYGENNTPVAAETINPQQNMCIVNPYLPKRNTANNNYVNANCRTISEAAAASGITLEEYLDNYALPKDLSANTREGVAHAMIPLWKVAEIYGVNSVEELDEMMNFPNGVNENTLWGEVSQGRLCRQYNGTQQQLGQQHHRGNGNGNGRGHRNSR